MNLFKLKKMPIKIAKIDNLKMCILSFGENVIKLFTAISYEFL